MIRFGVLTVSDRCHAGSAEDKSGPALASLLEGQLFACEVAAARIVPDEKSQIEAVLKEWCDRLRLDVVLTTGGTGFAPRDVTPEATRAVLDLEAPGISVAMMKASLDVTPMAMLSRAVSGVRGATLIVNLPGSPKGAVENAQTALKGIPHAVALMRGDTAKVEKVHQKLHCGCSHDSAEAVDVSKVALRPRKSPYPMVEVEAALETILKEVEDFTSVVKVPIHEALGKIAACNAVSTCKIPPYPASVKDGYAVLSQDGAGERLVMGDSVAGGVVSLEKLLPGQCLRITTGAAVCAGADAVVQVEDTELLESSADGKVELKIRILEAPTKGQDIRPTGSDLRLGDTVVHRGTKIGAAQIGALASAGLHQVKVFRQPQISVFSTGDEIQEIGSQRSGDVIFDSNRPTLVALLKQHGFDATDLGIARDDPEAITSTLKKAFECSSVVISSGGVSMGEKDFLKNVLLENLDAKIHFGRVNMKPGKPTTFATCCHKSGKKFVFALPGNPVSATVTCHLFALPAVRALSGLRGSDRGGEMTVRLAERVALDSRPEFCRAVLEREKAPTEKLPVAHLTGNQISSRLLSLQSGSVLLQLPASAEGRNFLDKDALVRALVID